MTDWNEQSQALRETEEHTRNDVNEQEEFKVVVREQVDPTDPRDYVDRMFWDFIPGTGMVRKKIMMGNCESGTIPKMPAKTLCVLLNYKMSSSRGIKDPLGGSHVFVSPSSKGNRITPLHLVRKYALSLLAAVDAIEDELAVMDISMEPEVD